MVSISEVIIQIPFERGGTAVLLLSQQYNEPCYRKLRHSIRFWQLIVTIEPIVLFLTRAGASPARTLLRSASAAPPRIGYGLGLPLPWRALPPTYPLIHSLYLL